MSDNKWTDDEYIKSLEGLSHRDFKALHLGVWTAPTCAICGAEKVHYRTMGYRCPHYDHHEMEQEREQKRIQRQFRLGR